MAGKSASTARRAVRVADLAAELGLSTATVSRALNGSRAVRPELVRRILEHARRRGYRPNSLARSLAARSTTFVGFLVPDIHNTAYSIAAGACARLLGRAGYQLILAITGDDPEREYEALTGLASTQVAAVIAAPSAQISDATRKAFAGLPVVEFNRTAELAARGVFCADRSAFAEATRHLLALGHAEFGYIGTTDAVSNGRERVEGVRSALAEAGITLEPERMRLLPPTESNGYSAARELLQTGRRPTALLVGSSSLSVGAMRAVQELRVGVPDEVSVVVYGDSEWARLCHPGLTMIAVPYQEMAEVVADLVRDLIARPADDPAARRRHCLPARLVTRHSTGPPRTPQPAGKR